jgi:hypothetical protein
VERNLRSAGRDLQNQDRRPNQPLWPCLIGEHSWYKVWREAFDAGKGGIFTLDVASVLEAMEKGISRR